MLQEEMWPEGFASILDRVTDGFFALDENWRFTYVNAQAAQLLFRDRDDLLGKCVWDEFPDAVETEFYRQYAKAMAEQVAVAFEEFYSPLNGWFEVRAFPSFGGLTVSFCDVTLKHQSQTRHEQHYQSLFYYNSDAVYSLTKDGYFLNVNPAVERLTGFTAQELIGTHYHSLILESDLEYTQRQFQQAVMGKSQTYMVSTRHKDGRILRLQVTNLPIFVDGQVIGVYGIAKDITELYETMERLRKSENRLIHAQRIAQLGYWEWDIVRNQIEQSEGLLHIYGVDRSSLHSYESFLEVVHPEDRKLMDERLRAALSGETFDMEFRILRPDGSERIIYSQAEFQFQDGAPVRMHGTSIDITERRRAEGARRAAETRFIALVQAAHDAIVVMDAAGEIKLWNNGAENIFGFTAEEMIGDTINRIALPNHRSHQIRGIGRLLKQRQYLYGNTIELPVVRKDGQTISIEFSLTELMNQNETHFIAIMRDVTDRKKMQTRLIETQQRYRSLIAHNPNGVCAVDKSKTLMESNYAFQEMLGYTGAELLNKYYCDLVIPEQRANLAEVLQTVLTGQVKTREEFTFRRKDGNLIDVGITHIPIWVQNHVVGSYAIVRDLTKEKQADEFMRKSDKLSAAGQLAAGVAHEIRNPLTALKGFLQLIASENGTEPRYIEIMNDELQRIEMIVSELLVLAKPQATRFLDRDIGERLQDVATLLSPQAVMNNVEIVLEVERNLPLVRCEQNQIKQVFINLIKNAIEAMPQGGKVSVKAFRVGKAVAVQVIDKGMGIPPELIRKLGDPFYTTKENGTGLGLMVSHKIIEAHHGTLAITSELGQGTTVTVTLPSLPHDIGTL